MFSVLVYLHRANKRSTAERVLAINTEMGYIGTMMSPIVSAVGSGIMSFLQSGQNSIVEGLPELLKVLQDVAAIHPFVARTFFSFPFARATIMSTLRQLPWARSRWRLSWTSSGAKMTRKSAYYSWR